MKKKAPSKPILVATHLPPDQRRLLRIAAANEGKSTSMILRELVTAFLKRKEVKL
jgi:plasmid stability protein